MLAGDRLRLRVLFLSFDRNDHWTVENFWIECLPRMGRLSPCWGSCEVGTRSRSSPLSNGHSDQKKEIKHVVANGLQPTSEVGLQQFQSCDLTIASVQDACKQAQKCPEKRVPVTAKRKECR